MRIPVKQVWVYEFKPTDTLRVLHGFMNIWRNEGTEIELVRKGDKLYAVRTDEDS